MISTQEKFLNCVFMVFGAGLFACSAIGADCEQEFMKHCPATANAEESFACAKKHVGQLSAECRDQLERSMSSYRSLKKECEDDLKKYCGVGFKELGAARKEKRAQCVVEHWSKLESGCQQVLIEQVPYLGLLQQSADAQEEARFGTHYKMKKLSGSGKKIKMVHEKDGTVWYIADLVKKNIVEEYEFCPEGKNPGLKRYINDKQPSCGYEVSADWKNEILRDLEKNDKLKQIDYHGILLQETLFNDSTIQGILNSYSKYCPTGFVPDVVVSFDRKNQTVYCERNYFTCSSGWYRTSPKESGGFFGCQLYASCEQTNVLSYEIGDPQYCAVCQAGGCIDESKTETDWSNIKIGYCKVNETNPHQTSGCKE